MEENTTLDAIIAVVAGFGLRVVAALVILFVGLWVAKKVTSLFRDVLTKKAIDPTLVGFFANMLYGAIVVFVAIASISKLGVETTSFAAVIAAAGLAIGLALQGSLSNFAAGVLLILFKPFKAGNFIKAGGEAGIVVEVGLLMTELKTPDGVKLMLPNSSIMTGAITNFSVNELRRVDMVIGVSYSDDLTKVMEVLKDMLSKDERVLAEPAPFIGVSELADSSINLVCRPWTKSSDFWQFKCDFTKLEKERLDAEGISIPFPQRDVHLFQEESAS